MKKEEIDTDPINENKVSDTNTEKVINNDNATPEEIEKDTRKSVNSEKINQTAVVQDDKEEIPEYQNDEKQDTKNANSRRQSEIYNDEVINFKKEENQENSQNVDNSGLHELKNQFVINELGNLFLGSNNERRQELFEDPTESFTVRKTLFNDAENVKIDDFLTNIENKHILILSSQDKKLTKSICHRIAASSKFTNKVQISFEDRKSNKEKLRLIDIVDNKLQKDEDVIIYVNINIEATVFFSSLLIEDPDFAYNIIEKLKSKNRYILCQLNRDDRKNAIAEKIRYNNFHFSYHHIDLLSEENINDYNKTEITESEVIKKYALFIAANFSDITPSEFNIIMETAIKDEYVEIVKEKEIIDEEGGKKTIKENQQKELCQVWEQSRDTIFSDCGLEILTNENMSQSICFIDVYQKEAAIKYFNQQPFFVSSVFEKLFIKTNFLDNIKSGTNIFIDSLITFCVKTTITDPNSIGTKLLIRLYDLYNNYNEEDYKKFLIKVIHEFLNYAVLHSIINDFLSYLHSKNVKMLVALLNAMSHTEFDKLFWIKKLIDEINDKEIIISLYLSLFNILENNDNIVPTLSKIIYWLPKEPTGNFRNSEIYSTLLIYDFVNHSTKLYSEVEINKQPIFKNIFSTNKEKQSKIINFLFEWLFHPVAFDVFYKLQFEEYYQQNMKLIVGIGIDKSIGEAFLIETFKIIIEEQLISSRCEIIEYWYSKFHSIADKSLSNKATEIVKLLIKQFVDSTDKFTQRKMKEYWRNKNKIQNAGKVDFKIAKEKRKKSKVINNLLKKIKEYQNLK